MRKIKKGMLPQWLLLPVCHLHRAILVQECFSHCFLFLGLLVCVFAFLLVMFLLFAFSVLRRFSLFTLLLFAFACLFCLHFLPNTVQMTILVLYAYTNCCTNSYVRGSEVFILWIRLITHFPIVYRYIICFGTCAQSR